MISHAGRCHALTGVHARRTAFGAPKVPSGAPQRHRSPIQRILRILKHREFGVSETVLGLKARMDAGSDEWEAALKKAIERAGAEERPKILDLDF